MDLGHSLERQFVCARAHVFSNKIIDIWPRQLGEFVAEMKSELWGRGAHVVFCCVCPAVHRTEGKKLGTNWKIDSPNWHAATCS